MITCLYCDSVATSGVDSVERDEYAPVCDAEYSPEFEYGYCDETLECAMSDGESLKAV